ncbi:MAG: hypothetical protein A2248_11830 [Candidatus Raymondbacteria bacterium RIFOXYA2_FULL_49_16]|nr:MAG: hypothetical protein A2248_11830 [Candidatus Raymondbacteria bacterium RIFOXYA2_FULL_49_16]
MVLMASDIQNRITSRPNIYFEVSTNEILNINSLKELIDDLNAKALTNVATFCTRYMKKVEVLGQNYEKMLAEQLANLSAKVSDAGA